MFCNRGILMSKMSDSPDHGQPEFFDYTDKTVTSSISQAILQNDADTLLKLLKKRKRNPLPVPADNRNWTVLHVAASRPQYKRCLELLLEYRDNILVDLNSQTFVGETALHIACENGCEESVEILLRNGCDPYAATLEGNSAVHLAVLQGHLKIVQSLLNYGESLEYRNADGLTPLHLSALYGYLEISRLLVDSGADIRSRTFECYLPLHLALQNNHFDIVRLLLKSDLTTINCDVGITLFTPLMLAVENCDLEDIRFLLENGAEAGTCDEKGRMPLHFAAYRGDVEILQLLLQYTDLSGVERCLSIIPNVLNGGESLYSLTCCAIHSENVECLEILLSSKLPTSILKVPQVDGAGTVYSPLAYLFNTISESKDELLNSFLQLLLEHKITMLDEFGASQIKWPPYVKFIHPFSTIFKFERPLLKQRYLNLLIANDVTSDYCLQCYHDNRQPFAGARIEHLLYYEPFVTAMTSRKVETVQFMISNSVILEPASGNFIDAMLKIYLTLSGISSLITGAFEDDLDVGRYLVSLEPTIYRRFELGRLSEPTSLCNDAVILNSRREFSQSTLKQLCRPVIRRHLREHTIEDNLRNFKRKIMELPLPVSLKDYLLFKN